MNSTVSHSSFRFSWAKPGLKCWCTTTKPEQCFTTGTESACGGSLCWDGENHFPRSQQGNRWVLPPAHPKYKAKSCCVPGSSIPGAGEWDWLNQRVGAQKYSATISKGWWNVKSLLTLFNLGISFSAGLVSGGRWARVLSLCPDAELGLEESASVCVQMHPDVCAHTPPPQNGS